MCCETANEISCLKTNILFVKEGTVSKIPHRNNRHKPTLFDGCMDWRVIADVDRQLAFPTEIISTRQRPDLIWSVNSKKLSLLNYRSLSRPTSTGRISGNWKSTKTYVNSVLRMTGQQTYFLLRLDIEVLFRTQPLHF